ncbi:acyltransferase [Kitasatospora sp. GP82]|uniref:acyltransferase family protein n=1 Tax=Kitasatospora sp. GP82 TaxID=3035089 RepID=UPI0024750839|nr:acyltransferase [Kitasatospora sp. GP82]MDH6127778.1 peptidoglycan/LPS O-acetylase OafA/YrhL [Kitasatospora sp. GP82]
MSTANTRAVAAPPDHAARLPSLTGMRWAAAMMIFCFHIMIESGFFGRRHAQDTMEWLFRGGTTGVSFFYVLSGFVLTWSARPNDPVTSFWRRRFARIYPNHFVTFLGAVALLSWEGQELSGRVAAANLTLTQSWAMFAPRYWYGYNGVSWSLSVEFFFYFTFPFLVPLIMRMGARAWWAIVVVCTGLVIAMPFPMDWVGAHTGIKPLFLVYQFPPVRLLEFLIGIALALLVRNGRWRGPNMTVSALVLVAGLLLTQKIVLWTQQSLMSASATGIIGCVLLIPAAARADVRGTSSIWRHPRMVRLGEISFAFYLVHELVIYTAMKLFNGPPRLPTVQAAALTIACFSVALVLATTLHDMVEKPFVKLLNPKSKRRRAEDTDADLPKARNEERRDEGVLLPTGGQSPLQ